MYNYATKSDLKGVAGIATSHFAKKADLASLELDTDKLDIDELEIILVKKTKSKSKTKLLKRLTI